MTADHTYSNQVMATQGLADGGVFNLQPSGCTVQEVSDRMAQIQSNLNDAKAQYAEFKKQAKEKADEAASAAAKIALWSFIALLAGAVVSALAGLWGVNTHPACRKIRA